MSKKVEDYELPPESEASDKNKVIWEKWRNKQRAAKKELFDSDPVAAEIALEEYIAEKRKRKLKQADDRIEHDEFEASGKLNELDELNMFHPKNTIGGPEYKPSEEDEVNAGRSFKRIDWSN